MIDNPRNCPVLSDTSIREYNSKGLLVESSIADHQIQPNSIDLTLGNTWKTLSSNISRKSFRYSQEWSHSTLDSFEEYDQPIIDPRLPMKYEEGTFSTYTDHLNPGKETELYVVHPRNFVLMSSSEILNIPNGIVGVLCARTSIGRLGLQVELANFVDAGFRGTITFHIYNQSLYHPILLFPGMRVAQVYFVKAQHAELPYGEARESKYKDLVEVAESRLHLDREFKS